ncbi:MAG: hypothetical protein P8R46_12960 [Planctomycetota bacterium]|nr:hypothetical protein [Planctomycetota bacterium]
MNRITALLLAFAALLTHVLVVHRDLGGAFGPPYESAHVAFQIARNFVLEGEFIWWRDPVSGEAFGGLWSHPSPLLVFLSSVFERLYLTVTRAVQVTGIMSVLATVWLCTRFDPKRILSVVSALLMVSCGAVAAAGGSGTEWPIVMALGTTAFVALEKGRPRSASLALALLAISTAAAIPLVFVLFLQTILKPEHFGSTSKLRRVVYFLPALGAVIAAELAGASLLGELKRIFSFNAEDAARGLNQLRDFCVPTVSPLLLIYPLIAFLLGELSAVGRRSLGLLATWCATTVLAGGGQPTFDLAFVPALPFAFIAIQQGLSRALDTYRPSMERLAWASVLLASAGSLAFNRFPATPLDEAAPTVYQRLLTPTAQRWPEPDRALGRPSLHAEVRDTNHLRRIGSFLRDRLPENTTLLTPWPGAIGYLSHFHVIDMFGRTEALPEQSPTAWAPVPPAANVAAALRTEPDFILPWLNGFDAMASGAGQEALPLNILGLDPQDSPSHRAEIRTLMAAYEPMVTAGRRGVTLLLLRRSDISPEPVVGHRMRKGRVLEFIVRFGRPEEKQPAQGLPQVFDAIVTAVHADGSRRVLNPVGEAKPQTPGQDVSPTMNGFVVDPRWPDAVSLARIPLDRLRATPGTQRIEVRLIHYRLSPSSPASDAVAPYVYELR